MFKIRQVLIQGGHNPNLKIEYYEDAFKLVRTKFPKVGVHGLSTSEIDMIARVEKSSTKEVLSRQLEFQRLFQSLQRMARANMHLMETKHISPLAFPIMVNRLRTRISSEKLADRVKRMQLRLEKKANL